MKGKTLVIPGLMNKFLAKIVRFVPRKVLPKIVRSMQEDK
jgi:short-subunit dehydrogenase